MTSLECSAISWRTSDAFASSGAQGLKPLLRDTQRINTSERFFSFSHLTGDEDRAFFGPTDGSFRRNALIVGRTVFDARRLAVARLNLETVSLAGTALGNHRATGFSVQYAITFRIASFCSGAADNVPLPSLGYHSVAISGNDLMFSSGRSHAGALETYI